MKDLRYLLFGMAFLLLFFIISPTIYAHNGNTYEVGTSSLNVRSAPSHDATIIGSLQPGDQVVAFEERYGWIQTYYDGQVAWVASQFLYPTKQSDSPANMSLDETVTVNVAGVHIRTGPGTDHSIKGFTTTGDTYTKIETKNDWHKVMLQDGSTGWIAAWLTNTPTPDNNNEKMVLQSNKSTNGSLDGYNIVLDPGHGGKDPGAIGFNGIMEKNLTLSTTEIVASYLREAGATVKVTREDDYYLSLEERVQFSNQFATDAFISLHYNAYPFMAVNGVGTYYYNSGEGLARSIQQEIAERVSLNNRGIHYGNYHVLRENSDLSVLIELGFITNPNDLFIIQTSQYQNNVAQAITAGVKNYFLR